MIYLPGQIRWFKRKLWRARLGGILLGIVAGVIFGFFWCDRVNVHPQRALIVELKSELKKGSYVPPRPASHEELRKEMKKIVTSKKTPEELKKEIRWP